MKFMLILGLVAVITLGGMAFLESGNGSYSWYSQHTQSISDYIPRIR